MNRRLQYGGIEVYGLRLMVSPDEAVSGTIFLELERLVSEVHTVLQGQRGTFLHHRARTTHEHQQLLLQVGELRDLGCEIRSTALENYLFPPMNVCRVCLVCGVCGVCGVCTAFFVYLDLEVRPSSACLSVRLSVCFSVCFSVCLGGDVDRGGVLLLLVVVSDQLKLPK